MNTLHVVIEKTENNFSAYIEELDGVISTGSTIEEIKSNIVKAIEAFVEACKEVGCPIPDEVKSGYDLQFKIDTQSLLSIYYGIFSKSGLERITGINQKQLWHYAAGKSKPRAAQKVKIENALHRLGEELISLHL